MWKRNRVSGADIDAERITEAKASWDAYGEFRREAAGYGIDTDADLSRALMGRIPMCMTCGAAVPAAEYAWELHRSWHEEQMGDDTRTAEV